MKEYAKNFIGCLVLCLLISLCYFGGAWSIGKLSSVVSWFYRNVGEPGLEWLQRHPPLLILAICVAVAAPIALIQTLQERK